MCSIPCWKAPVFDPGVLLMNQPIEPTGRPGRWLTPRRVALPWVLWVFGLSTTLLLVGLWGRAITVDQNTITRSTEAALSAELVTERDHVLRVYGLLTARYAMVPGGEALDGEALEAAFGCFAEKNTAVIVHPTKTVTWDHTKLGGAY